MVVAAFRVMATIDRVWISGVGDVRVGIFVHDHCDPHATCRDQNRQWTVRINFSFINDVVSLKDIMPPNAQVPNHALRRLKVTVEGNLAGYRSAWWKNQSGNPTSQSQGACCLNNKMFRGCHVTLATFDLATRKTTVALSDGTMYVWPP
jgi:hypothetical protein